MSEEKKRKIGPREAQLRALREQQWKDQEEKRKAAEAALKKAENTTKKTKKEKVA